jgi:hypothetical protein
VTWTIPYQKLIATKCYFFLDTLFSELYTFVNCNKVLQSRCHIEKGRIENHGNEKGSQETGQESNKEGREEEVSK